MPQVEFVKGIPEALESDHYLDRNVRNCLILDDLMGDAKKDERVANLFTKGSHHRNLSVFYLTQNLFPQGKASRDVCLNTKYLVLFNNPVDRHQVALLARRIFPHNSHQFMKTYIDTVQQPYGHLLIDLRAQTPEHARLKPNALTSIRAVEPIRAQPALQKQYSTDYSDMPSCSQCGLVFADIEALIEHSKMGCRKPKEDSPAKKRKYDEEWLDIILQKAIESLEDEWERKFDKYSEDMDEDEAKQKAYEKMRPLYYKEALNMYTTTIQRMLLAEQSYIHSQIMDDIEEYKENGMSEDTAIKAAIKKNSHFIESEFDQFDIGEESDDSEEESDDEY